MPEKIKTAVERIKEKVQLRWGNEQATLVAIEEVAAEYEPRVAALESQIAKLLAELGEVPAKGKGGK
jgi:uncharacterized small protein (DUF1192 family)